MIKAKEKSSKIIIFRFVPMIVMMIVIFAFSHMPGDESSDTSLRVLEPILKLIEGLSKHSVASDTKASLNWLLRKAAHFTEYAFFGLTVLYAMKAFFEKAWKWMALSEVIAIIYATTDEIHQYFVPGRYMAFLDVCIDSTGALTGILLSYLIYKKLKKKRELKNEKV